MDYTRPSPPHAARVEIGLSSSDSLLLACIKNRSICVKTRLIVKRGHMVFVVHVCIGQIANGLFRFAHVGKGMVDPPILPFAERSDFLHAIFENKKFKS